jgi:hypothetical protein
MKRITIKYPDPFNEQDYKEFLMLEYRNQPFTLKQIAFPINRIIGIIDCAIKEFAINDYIISRISLVKQLSLKREYSDDVENAPKYIANIFYFSSKKRKVIESIARVCEIKFPEERATEYLQYVSDVTKRIVRDICEATETTISHASKISSQRSVINDNSKSQIASDSSWAKRHGAKNKDLHQPSKKVTWEDRLKVGNKKGEKVK